MALKKSWSFPHKFSSAGAYHKVFLPQVTGDNNLVDFIVGIFYDVGAKESGGIPLEKSRHTAPYDVLSAVGVISQCYSYLKTLPEYEGSEDI